MSQAQQICHGDALRKHVSLSANLWHCGRHVAGHHKTSIGYLPRTMHQINCKDRRKSWKSNLTPKKELPTLPHSSTGANLLFVSAELQTSHLFLLRHSSHRQPSSCRIANLHRRAISPEHNTTKHSHKQKQQSRWRHRQSRALSPLT